ncbi:casein kinase 2 regulatory subunit [Sporothrix eucalyptigena]
MDDFVSETDSEYTSYWRDWFISSRGNEYFCEIDEDYLTDRFNLTGLNTEVQYYQYALDLVTDVFDLDCDDEMRETIEKSARHLYGLVHARYVVTTRGLAKMNTKRDDMRRRLRRQEIESGFKDGDDEDIEDEEQDEGGDQLRSNQDQRMPNSGSMAA